jgi:hypothetical protein
MSHDNGEARATNTTDRANMVDQIIRLALVRPQRIATWFVMLEAQFEAAHITNDRAKYSAVIANLGEQYLDQIEDILFDPPATRRYELLKAELIRRLTDSDRKRVQRLLETEEIGDRTPSQFYRDLKKLATPAISEDRILTLWKNRLPTNMRLILASAKATSANDLTDIADRIHEIRLEEERSATVSVTNTTDIHRPGKHRAMNEVHDEIKRLRAQLTALSIDHRRRFRSCSRRRRPRSGSSSRERKQQTGWCYYHRTFQARARKCRFPCSWNQRNANNRP